jgi:hypothetical protein
MSNLKEPESIAPHAGDYRPTAWHEYDLRELGAWVHLLVKRAGMRADPEKARKDLADAENYHAMMQAHIDAAKERLP